jgi:ADP-heptose:LPS heptosyltransferase
MSSSRILVRRVGSLGGTILMLPLIRNLRCLFPTHELSLMIPPAYSPLLFTYAEQFVSPEPLTMLGKHLCTYDFVFDLNYQVPQDYEPRPLKQGVINHIGTVAWDPPGQHITIRMLNGLAAHGIQVSYIEPRIYVRPEALETAWNWLAAAGVHLFRSPLVAISPNSGFLHKRWPVNQFLDLADILINDLNATVLMIARDETDFHFVTSARNRKDGRIHLLSGLPLDALSGIFSYVDLHVGNDSGLAHLAAAVGTSTVTIFGPTAPSLWKPVGPKAITVYRDDATCPLYGPATADSDAAGRTDWWYAHAETCEDQVCLTRILVEDVLESCMQALGMRASQTTNHNV